MDVADKIRSGARWLGAAKAVTQIYTWVLTVLIMRILAPEDYALMAMAGVFIAFIAQFEELGLRTRLVQMADYTLDHARAVFGLVLLTNFASTTLLALASPLIADFFGQPRLSLIIITLSVSMLISAMGSIPDALIKRNLDFRSLAAIDVVRALIASTATLAMAYAGFGVWSLVWGTLIGSFVGTVGLMIASPSRALPSFNFKGLGATVHFGGLVMLQRLVWWAYSGLDSLLIGKFYPVAALGLYSTAAQFASLPREKVGQILNVLSFTGFSRVNQDLAMFRHYLERAMKLVAIVLFPAFLGITAVAYEFTPVVLGEKWAGLAPIAAILALSAAPRSISSILTEALNALGKPQVYLKCVVVTAVLFALGIVAGLPIGLEAIGIGIAVASLLGYLYNVFVVAKHVEMPAMRMLASVASATLSGLVMLSLLLVLRPLLPLPFPSVTGLLATIALGVVVYGGMLRLIDRDGFRLALALVRKR